MKIIRDILSNIQEQTKLSFTSDEIEYLLNYLANIKKLYSSNTEIADSLLLNWIIPLIRKNNIENKKSLSSKLQDIGKFPRFQNCLRMIEKQDW